ncbi:related to 50S ribosomal protein L4 [Melanopsichium pennsylvanicum]|uniref:Large ribosomal subunit protein uL4m n=2 Tax=Melanopsichium pennsylvanicum TaxID=63383 RepID=A0AAJ4XIG6_9BASI|nr:related to 50S ribosomal protein L4 [Melanopsichium pennsylvanicum 4]SNX81758.1 related to 50S ribosomal protein L4 [Melanopsichium pennsylvanicum]
MALLPSSKALASLASLRSALQSINAQPIPAAPRTALRTASSFASSSSIHTSATTYNQAAASSSTASAPAESSSSTFAAASEPSTQENLHATEFDFDGETYEIPPFDEGDLVAVSSKAPIVHVKLSNLHKPAAPKSSAKSYVPLSAHVFDAPARRDVIHSAVVYYLDAQRSGTASTKGRSDVRGSMRKLRPQKGSGQARLGTMSNPILRGGAVAHGPRPRDHSTKLPRRVRELALRSALSSKWRQGNLHVVDNFDWIAPPSSTGPLARLLGSKRWSDALFLTAPRNPQPSIRSLINDARPSSSDPVYDEQQRLDHQQAIRNFVLASNNIPRVELIELDALTQEYRDNTAKTSDDKKKPGELHAYEVLRRHKVICDLGAVEWLEEKLGGAIFHQEAGPDELADSLQHNQLDAANIAEADTPSEQSQSDLNPAPVTPQPSAAA